MSSFLMHTTSFVENVENKNIVLMRSALLNSPRQTFNMISSPPKCTCSLRQTCCWYTLHHYECITLCMFSLYIYNHNMIAIDYMLELNQGKFILLRKPERKWHSENIVMSLLLTQELWAAWHQLKRNSHRPRCRIRVYMMYTLKKLFPCMFNLWKNTHPRSFNVVTLCYFNMLLKMLSVRNLIHILKTLNRTQHVGTSSSPGTWHIVCHILFFLKIDWNDAFSNGEHYEWNMQVRLAVTSAYAFMIISSHHTQNSL